MRVCVAGVWAAALLASVLVTGCGKGATPEVVVYTSTDQVEARKILDGFERETGIRVRPVFDTEAQKTTGLAMKLLAEAERPTADVFWNNELSRTIMLLERNVLTPYASPAAADIPAEWKDAGGAWASFSWRARVLVYNTELVQADEAPRTLEALCEAKWRGKVGIANPLFGTTSAHAAALAGALGEEAALEYFRRLKANGVVVFEGNSVVRDAVARGEVLVGLTDTDDVLAGKANGMSVDLVYPDQGPEELGTLLIGNSVALVTGAPNETEGKRFIDYLLSLPVEEAFGGPSKGRFPVKGADGPKIKAMEVDWAAVAETTSDVSARVGQVLAE